jgi:hypothetical protein
VAKAFCVASEDKHVCTSQIGANFKKGGPNGAATHALHHSWSFLASKHLLDRLNACNTLVKSL